MRVSRLSVVLGLVLLSVTSVSIAWTAPTLPRVLPPHPRLMLTDTDLATLCATIHSDPDAKGMYSNLIEIGEAMIGQPFITYPNCTVVGACRGPLFTGYIDASRFGTRVLTLALLHRLDSCPAMAPRTSTTRGFDGEQPPVREKRSGFETTNSSSHPEAVTPGLGSLWSDRAVAEMTNVSAFPSWYWPVGQALELAEMSYAFAVAYDWYVGLFNNCYELS